MIRFSGVAAVLAMTMSLPVTGRAMQFEPVALSPADLVVFGRGPIVAGDADRLNRALTAVPAGQTLLGLAQPSPQTDARMMGRRPKRSDNSPRMGAAKNCMAA